MIRVAACQAVLDIDDAAASWHTALDLARDAASAGARLVVLPELATTGYAFHDRAEASGAARGAGAARLEELRNLSGELGVVLVAGLAQDAPDGPFNAAAVCDAGRLVGIYRKVHLWDRESLYFSPGGQGPLVVDTSAGRVGVMVCYDLEFPEWPRLARQQGADVIAVPVNWPLLPRPHGVHPIEVAKAQAAAGAYRVPVVICDRAGSERGVDWIGGSCIVGRDGYLLAGPVLDGTRSVVLVDDVEPAGELVLGERNDALGDRRTDLYGEHEGVG